MAFPIDHDLHCHSVLSECSSNPEQSKEAILAHAKANHYTVQCITDHLWDNLVPDPSNWYRPQDIDHVKQNLPLPEDDEVKMVFGCETEYCGGKKLGLHPSHYDVFDMIVIPPNHFHMKNFVRPECYDTEEKVADLMVERLEQLSEFDLPWHKVGIAHLNCGLVFREGDRHLVYRLVNEKRFRAVMNKFARLGAGIELNCGCLQEGWEAHADDEMRLFRLAKEEGCKFYLATDAHNPPELDFVPKFAPEYINRLGLTEKDQWTIGK